MNNDIPPVNADPTRGVLLRVLGDVSAAIAIPAFLLALPPIQSWIFNEEARAEIALVSEIPVFDVRRPIPGLSVVYAGRDLTSSRQALVASKLRIENVGGKSITSAETTST
jgi:hypothetical protein